MKKYNTIYVPERGGWVKDIKGLRFGRLLVIGFSHVNDYNDACWLTVCDCGKETTISGSSMRKGATKSCGCFAREIRGLIGRTHGMSYSKVYKAWRQMKRRCIDPNSPSFPDYGGRGITVSKSWMKFENFYKDMGDPPTPEHSIDRIENDKGYYKENCRWATAKEQSNNTRRNVRLTYRGETKTATEWSRQLDIDRHLIYQRLKNGWTVEQTLGSTSGTTINKKVSKK